MFEFDPDKSAANLAKHGIDFDEAQALWNDDKRVTGPTFAGGDDERWMVVGRIGDRLWTAVVTYRDEVTRLISVRRARPKEERQYDEQSD
jgi:uncharacterized protein